MSGRTWFAADTHFGHDSVRRHCARPFASAGRDGRGAGGELERCLAPGDTVWHLGDFGPRQPERAERYLGMLNGTVHLVWGNHDGDGVRRLRAWASSRQIAEIVVDGVPLVMCHYAMRTWNRARYGARHPYGHSHGRLPSERGRSCDVGVDAWGFRPAALKEILARMDAQRDRENEPGVVPVIHAATIAPGALAPMQGLLAKTQRALRTWAT